MSRPKSNTISPALRNILSNPSAANLSQFDPWNSSSTGHQRSENPCSGTAWREARNQKLATQFGKKTGGAGPEQDGEWKWVKPEEMEEEMRKAEKNKDIRFFFGAKKMRTGEDQNDGMKAGRGLSRGTAGVGGPDTYHNKILAEGIAKSGCKNGEIDIVQQVHIPESDVSGKGDCPDKRVGQSKQSAGSVYSADTITQNFDTFIPPSSQLAQSSSSKNKGIFNNLTIYINGSTFPLISDHKLKNVLAENGANISIHLARRSVTHVILGRPNSRSEGMAVAGAGGGLAARKLQREIQRVGGKGVKYVGVEW